MTLQAGLLTVASALAGVQEVYRRVGSRVRALRQSRGWTQDVFAEKSGLHRAHIGEIERGQTNITLLTLKLLADTLKVSCADLLRNI